MDTKAFLFNSQAKYRTDSHFKEKADILSLANQEIMVDAKGSPLRPCFRTSLPTIRTLRSLETLQWQTRHGKSGKTLPSAGGSASLTSPSGAPLSVVGFHLRTTSKRRSPFLPAYTASTSTIRPGACLKSCVSPPRDKSHSWYENPYNSRAYKRLCFEFGVAPDMTGGRSWITDVKSSDFGVPS